MKLVKKLEFIYDQKFTIKKIEEKRVIVLNNPVEKVDRKVRELK